MDERTGFQSGEILAGMGLTRGAEPAISRPITSESIMGLAQRFTIKLNGVTKTLDLATGAALHRLAGSIEGHPVKLTTGGVAVPNSDDPFAIADGQEFSICA